MTSFLLRPAAARCGAVIAAALASLAGSGPAHAADLPLGPPSLDERRTTVRVAPGVEWTRIVRGGPWRVHLLTVDRSAIAGHVGAVLAGERAGALERISSMARRRDAVAGVNGGYYAVRAPDVGDPVGVVVAEGRLVSEPVGARTALLVPRSLGAPPTVAALRFAGGVRFEGRSRLVDGVDRNRGRIPGCGGLGGDIPTERINPFITCTDASELVVYSPAFGSRTRTAAGGYEAIVRAGVVTSLRRGGESAIPSDGYVLSGSGDAATLLRTAAQVGARPELSLALRDGLGTVEPQDHRAIMGGAPRLVRAGRVDITPGLEGRAGLEGGRSPRTVAGVRSDGALLFMVIDGRRPGWSLGATLREAAATIRSLGAREAVNLDSGGSSAMVIRGRVVSRPSDAGGERAVSNGLFVLPNG